MKRTTLCYLERDGKYLMLYRNKKETDENGGKWIGVGGKVEPGESVEDCLLREVREETGYTLRSYAFRGVVRFVSDVWGSQDMYLYTSDDFTGELLADCDEGELAWVPKNEILNLPLWEGDKVFLKLLETETEPFRLLLEYEGDDLVKIERQ